MGQELEVWLDCDLTARQRIGTLHHDREQVRFIYEKSWIAEPLAFAIDPQLTLDAAPFYPRPEAGNFGTFLDSSPDRWGQTLMKRREALAAKDEGRKARNLYAWDYLLGVQDFTRQGALRFRVAGTETFLGAEKMSAPPVASLRELQAIALELTRKKIDDLDALRRWLAVLVAPGASLGGARPKANFQERDGSLWFAKFPAHDDERDIGGWEAVTHQLAVSAGVDVAEARVEKLNGDFHTFCVRRFDRVGKQRRFYVSAMTILRKDTSDGTSYLEFAQALRQSGDGPNVSRDLAQLFRRVVFNVAIGNRDDHLRNHGFLLAKTGWRLSPAFDVNPNIDKSEHVLCIDDVDQRPSLDTVLSTADFYGLPEDDAVRIVREVVAAVRPWREVAARGGVSAADIEVTAGAFSALTEFDEGNNSASTPPIPGKRR